MLLFSLKTNQKTTRFLSHGLPRRDMRMVDREFVSARLVAKLRATDPLTPAAGETSDCTCSHAQCGINNHLVDG